MSTDTERAPASPAPAAAIASGDTTMNYMARFGCIGPACEENCCQDGWRIDVNKDGYERLLAATQFAPREISKRVQMAIRVVPRKSKTERERYIIKQDKSGACPLFDDGWCAIHANFGLDMLPHVCAIYPRKLKRVGPRHELSATASCPEIARQLILHADGVDVVPLDLAKLNRTVLQDGMDTRDVRPFFRSLVMVRDFMMDLFRDQSLTLDQRYFLMAWFAKRTNDVLQKALPTGDLAPVERELALLARPEVRREITKRFELLDTPAAVVLIVVRAVVRPKVKGLVRKRWNELTQTTIDSYSRLKEILPSSDADVAVHDEADELAPTERQLMTLREVWDTYRARRDRLRAHPVAQARLDQYFQNYVIHTWYHRMPTEEEDILHYALRMLAQHATMKFLLIGHPRLQTVMDEVDRMPKDEGDRHLATELDKVAVDVFYQLARHIEHGLLIKWLNKMLKTQNLFSMAGAVYLIRF